jgi:hypothetical protein
MEGDAGWVLWAEAPHAAQRAERRLERVGVERVVALRDGAICAELSDPPSEALRKRIAAILHHPVEERLNCDVAQYPLGRGSLVWFLEPPAEGLLSVVDALKPVYREIVWPLSAEEPVHLCLPALALPEPAAVGAALTEAGVTVRAAYEVGGCRR